MPAAKISIVIIVKNDLGIAETLQGVSTQVKKSGLKSEIIVVDASSPEFLADIRARFPDVRWLPFTSKSGRRFTIPEQRNMGVREAVGDVVVFIDANCIPQKHWFTNLVGPILDESETMTAGTVVAKNPRTLVNLNSDDGNEKYLQSSPTINLAFRRSIAVQVGGFDESYSYGSDVDFTWRCTDLGNRILFVRSATVMHDWGTFGEEVKRSERYGRARAKLYLKHANRRKELIGKESVMIPVYAGWLLGLPLTLLWWWYPLTILALLLKNARHKPFRTVFLHLVYSFGFMRGLARLALRLPA